MADVEENVTLFEVILILGAVGVGIYFLYKLFSSCTAVAAAKTVGAVAKCFGSTCIAKVGALPGISGATKSQVCAANCAAKILKPGGKDIWSCGTDFDYLQPCGEIVTEARHNPLNYVWPWSAVMNYKCVPVNCYTLPTTGCHPSPMQTPPASSAGSPACCGGKGSFFCCDCTVPKGCIVQCGG